MRSYTKAELAEKAGVSSATFRNWLLAVEDDIPKPYSRRQKVLRPEQAAFIMEHLCLGE